MAIILAYACIIATIIDQPSTLLTPLDVRIDQSSSTFQQQRTVRAMTGSSFNICAGQLIASLHSAYTGRTFAR